MESKILWEAKQSQKNKSNLFRYENFLSSKYKFIPTQNYNTSQYSSQIGNQPFQEEKDPFNSILNKVLLAETKQFFLKSKNINGNQEELIYKN